MQRVCAPIRYFKPVTPNRKLIKVICNPLGSKWLGRNNLYSAQVKSLVSADANANHKTADGNSMLHLIINKEIPYTYRHNALWQHHDELDDQHNLAMSALIENGADIFALDNKGRSPWFYAVKQQDWLSWCFITLVLIKIELHPAKFLGKESLMLKEILAVLQEDHPHHLVQNTLERLNNVMQRLNQRPVAPSALR